VTWLRPLAWSRDADQILADFERQRRLNDELATYRGRRRRYARPQITRPALAADAGFSPGRSVRRVITCHPRGMRVQLDLYVVPVNPAANKTPAERRYTMTLGSELAT
jgi:hypothetical protein